MLRPLPPAAALPGLQGSGVQLLEAMDRPQHGALAQLLSSYVLALLRAIAACRELQALLQLLGQAADTLLDPSDLSSAAEAGGHELRERHEALAVAAAEAAAARGQPAAQLLRPIFYASPAFQELAETLLTGGRDLCLACCSCWPPCHSSPPNHLPARAPGPAVVAPDWLPRMSPQQRQRLFDAWFEAAPAAALLPALARCAVPGRLWRAWAHAYRGPEANFCTLLCLPFCFHQPPLQAPGGGAAQQRAGQGGARPRHGCLCRRGSCHAGGPLRCAWQLWRS